MKQAIAVFLSLAVLSVGTPKMSNAEWNQGELPLDTDMHAWFMTLKSPLGGICCDEGDGSPVTDWTIVDGHYQIVIFGKTMDVPANVVLKIPNRLGEPVAWTLPYRSDHPVQIVCFLPGTMG